MKKNIAKQTFWLKICKTQKNQIKVLLPIYRLCIKLKKIATFLLKLIQGILLVKCSYFADKKVSLRCRAKAVLIFHYTEGRAESIYFE